MLGRISAITDQNDSPHQSYTAILETAVCDVLGTRPILQSGSDAVHTLLADFRQAPGGVVPVLRQGQHPFGFQRQPRVAQVVVGHHRVVAGFLNAKYRHGITSLRRSEKVFVLGKKAASMPSGYPGGENLWAGALPLIVGEKACNF